MIKIIVKTPAVYYRGLHDRESSEFGYKLRNQKKSIPEVTKCGNGEVYPLTEPIEWIWYWSWAWRYPPLFQVEKVLYIGAPKCVAMERSLIDSVATKNIRGY